MPKTTDYPRSSLKTSLDLAKAVSDLGGSAKIETAAEKLNLKKGGHLHSLISAAKKYGLIETVRGQLTVTSLYREYKHAYNPEEAAKVLKQAFLGVPLFHKVYERFQDTKLPIDILPKLLIREFEVDEAAATRVAGYLVEAGRLSTLLDGDNLFVREIPFAPSPQDVEVFETWEATDESVEVGNFNFEKHERDESSPIDAQYVVHFRGPGIDSRVHILDKDDISIVQAILSKIEKRVRQRDQDLMPDADY